MKTGYILIGSNNEIISEVSEPEFWILLQTGILLALYDEGLISDLQLHHAQEKLLSMKATQR